MGGKNKTTLFSFIFPKSQSSSLDKGEEKRQDSEDRSSQEENAMEEFAWIALKNKQTKTNKNTCS